MSEEETPNKIETYSLEMFSNMKEAKYEKPKFEKAVDATIVGLPEIHANSEDKVGKTRKGDKEFLKFYFTVKFMDSENNEFRESYGFQVFSDDKGKKAVYYGKDSATREFIDVALQYVPEINAESSTGDILKAIADKKVKVITKFYGPTKSPKTQVISYL